MLQFQLGNENKSTCTLAGYKKVNFSLRQDAIPLANVNTAPCLCLCFLFFWLLLACATHMNTVSPSQVLTEVLLRKSNLATIIPHNEIQSNVT